MIKHIIEQWEENKDKLQKYFETTEQSKYDSYELILKKILDIVVTKADEYGDSWDTDNMTVIDDGDYQGTQIFIIPRDTYQPSSIDYLVTNTYYGSCSGCDTLQSIHNYDMEIPNAEQVKDYMLLSLHLIQKMKMMYSVEEEICC